MIQSFVYAYFVWKRDMKLWVRQKWLAVASFIGPLLYLLLFTSGMGGLVPPMYLAQYGRVTYIDFASAGFVMMGVFIATCMSSASIFFDREFRLLHDLFTTAMPKHSYVFGKIVATATKSSLVGIILLGITVALMERPIGAADFLVALVGIVLISIAISSVATSLASYVTTQALYNTVINIITVPTFLFSNIFYPLEILPPVLRYGAMINPVTYLNNLLRAILLGAPSAYNLASSMLVLSVVAALGGLACGRGISRRLD